MVHVCYSEHFRRAAKKLSKQLQEKLAEAIALLGENPFHAKLHTKPLSGKLSGLYSFRITRDWRVIFQFLSQDKIYLVDVGNRKEIYE